MVQAPGWSSQKAVCKANKQPRPLPKGSQAEETFERPSQLSKQGEQLEKSLQAACKALSAAAAQLDAWDRECVPFLFPLKRGSCSIHFW